MLRKSVSALKFEMGDQRIHRELSSQQTDRDKETGSMLIS